MIYKLWKINAVIRMGSEKGFTMRNFIVSTIHQTDCLIGMLLVSSSGLLEEDAVEVFHYYGFHFSAFLM